MPDAEALGCATRMCERCRAIVGTGTSADAQIAVFEAHEKTGEPRTRARCGERLARRRDAAVRQDSDFVACCEANRPTSRSSAGPAGNAPPSGRVLCRHRALHHQAAGARVDHTERAQRQQRERLHVVARLAGIGRAAPADRSALRAAARPARPQQPPRSARAGDRPAIAARMRSSISVGERPAAPRGANTSTAASTGSPLTAQASRRWRSARAARVIEPGRERRERAGRRIGGSPKGGDLARRHRLDQRPHEVGLGREIAIDRPGRDAGALPPPAAIWTAPRPMSAAIARAAATMPSWRAARCCRTRSVRR